MRGPDAERSRLDFERWRAASPQHRSVYAEMEAISRTTHQLGNSALGRDYRALPARPPLFQRPAFRLMAAGIAILLAAGGAMFLLAGSGRIAVSNAGGQVIASATGQLRRLHLPDGSTVVLDTDTQIEITYDASARLVRLVRGRARFDVAAVAGTPFMVEAGDRLILDRGTVFDVALGRDGVKVSLLRGAVEIHEPLGTGRPGRVLAHLSPGQLALVGSEDARVQAAPVGADRWVEGLLSYDNARLVDVVADINRYSQHKLRFTGPALGDLRVTGVFRAVPLDAAARTLAAALGLHVATAENGDLILRR